MGILASAPVANRPCRKRRRLLLQAKVFIIYLKLLVWPFHLQGRYSVGETDALAVVALIANVILVIIAIIAWRRSRRGKLLALAIAWFYISLAPVSNLIPLPGAMMGERFIYFTFAGMIPLLLGSINDQVLSRYSRQILLITSVFFAVFLFTNVTRAMVWKDNAQFFKVLSKQEPNNPIVQIRAAQTELESGNTAAALSRMERLVEADLSTPFETNRASVSYWYGQTLLLSNRPAEAYVQFSQAAALDTSHSQDLVLLQVEAAARSDNLEAARTLLDGEIKITPGESKLWNALGNVWSMSGNFKSAAEAYTKAVELDPKNKEAARNLQNIKYRSAGKR